MSVHDSYRCQHHTISENKVSTKIEAQQTWPFRVAIITIETIVLTAMLATASISSEGLAAIEGTGKRLGSECSIDLLDCWRKRALMV